MEEGVGYSSRASLVALGLKFQRLQLLSPIRNHVKIKQKVLKHTLLDKVLDCFINILAGGTGVVEVNTRVRPDQPVQRAFGRSTCAEQSTISDTLNACTSENAQQLRQAIQIILREHGQSYRHDYETQWHLLDVDVTGMHAGRLGEGVTKVYWAKTSSVTNLP